VMLAGFDGHIEKPISVRALPELIDGYLAKGGRSDG